MSNTIIDKMFAVGAHFGYRKSRRHPSMKPFVFGAKNRTEIFDLEKTDEYLSKTKEFIAKLAAEGKTILFVSTKAEGKTIMKEAAQSIDMPYVTERWIGGTMTNFSEIKKRVSRLLDLIDKKEKGELVKYTKKEQMLLGREIGKLQKNFGGISTMKDLPDAVFVVDPQKEETAVIEATKKNIPVIALASTDCDITDVDHVIPANDSSVKSIEFFVNEVVDAYKDARKKQ
ncbi:30S ribosomal protein S2 [Patescibacteria group bacterium]